MTTLSDDRLVELAASAERGEPIPQADAVELVREAAMWRARFAGLLAEALKVIGAADRCVYALVGRHDRELASARHEMRRLARAACISLPTLEYDHDEDEGR